MLTGGEGQGFVRRHIFRPTIQENNESLNHRHRYLLIIHIQSTLYLHGHSTNGAVRVEYLCRYSIKKIHNPSIIKNGSFET